MLWAAHGAVLKELSDGTRTSLLHFQHLFHVMCMQRIQDFADYTES